MLTAAEAKLLSLAARYKSDRQLLFDFVLSTNGQTYSGYGAISAHRVRLDAREATSSFNTGIRALERAIILDGSRYSDLNALQDTISVGALKAPPLAFVFLDSARSRQVQVEALDAADTRLRISSREGFVILTIDNSTKYISRIESGNDFLDLRNTRRLSYDLPMENFKTIESAPGFSRSETAPTFPLVP